LVIWPWLANTINTNSSKVRVDSLSQGETIMSAFVHSATVHAHVHPARFSIGSLIALGGALAVLSRLFGMA
jgi:hypothetical protein